MIKRVGPILIEVNDFRVPEFTRYLLNINKLQ